ncbi:MAG: hypothetical protein ISP90_07935 [Nevskia sp.]|nr:hypothetical protein [Nevskia sp.]
MSKTFKYAFALPLLALLAGGLSGCLFGHRASPAPEPAPAAMFPSVLQHAIAIQVVDQRPPLETVSDPSFASGYAYTTDRADEQVRSFVAAVGANLRAGKGISAYRNGNAGEAADPAGLRFTFLVRHWYAKWPMHTSASIIPVEGEIVVELQVFKGERIVYDQPYRTPGEPLAADLGALTRQNYASFIAISLSTKQNQLQDDAVKLIVKDLAGNWPAIAAAENG